MTRRKRDPLPVRRLREEALRNEAGTPARKHHLVPASYLRRWAEDDSKGRSKLRVTEIDRATSYCVGPDNAARETDFYRVEHPDLDPAKVPPSLFETHLSKIERNAKHAISELIEHRATYSLGPDQFVLFAWHLAYTATRGRAFRARTNAVATAHYRLIPESITDSTIAARIRGLGEDPTPELVASCRQVFDDVRDGKLIARHDESAVILLSADIAKGIGERLCKRTWLVYDTPPVLVTCDEPVVAIGGPGAARGEYCGIDGAGAIVYPLSPAHLLVMFHSKLEPPEGPLALDHAETAEINREIIAAGNRWAFERPGRRVTERLRVPPLPSTGVRTQGPFRPVRGDTEVREIFRQFVPTRWADEAIPPAWPVDRWWKEWDYDRYRC
ncbi:DUF4238 domain-containing protein [Nocardia carnea]|uniref:DUF4238 domain-containing protein n=1 Tax=Nocardia carnea TaxID=37328 RepID=UPI002455EEEA|nr:DUF4238 domain-containing protein [Nocardia carnea]